MDRASVSGAENLGSNPGGSTKPKNTTNLTAMTDKPIANYLRLESADATALSRALTAAQAWISAEYTASMQTIGDNGYYFLTTWEPPFKQLKQLSKEHPKVSWTLWADAFATDHWICKSIFTAGKSEDWVVSIVDDAFESIFKEVYGQSYSSWKTDPKPAFANIQATANVA